MAMGDLPSRQNQSDRAIEGFFRVGDGRQPRWKAGLKSAVERVS